MQFLAIQLQLCMQACTFLSCRIIANYIPGINITSMHIVCLHMKQRQRSLSTQINFSSIKLIACCSWSQLATPVLVGSSHSSMFVQLRPLLNCIWLYVCVAYSYIANYLVVISHMFLICVPLKLSHHLFAVVVIGLMHMSMLKFIHCSQLTMTNYQSFSYVIYLQLVSQLHSCTFCSAHAYTPI